MKKTSVILLSSLLFAALLAYPKENLSPEHKKWLENVTPIITKAEKEVFFQLKADRERDKFIQLFWKKRDPLPDTNENEFYQEYMERLRFADLYFGHGSPKRGSQTERGYFYLLLGPPLERNIFATHSELWPLELWEYKGEQQYGLPPYFYLIFYQDRGIGEYRLYYPGVEGPEKLLIPSLTGRTLSRSRAYQAMKKISGDLASASLSYLPGDASFGDTPFSSNTIIASVRSLPEKKFTDSYARDFLYYKDYIETDYTHDFIDSNSSVKVFKSGSQSYIHWTLEPKKINFANYKGKFYSAYQLVVRIEDMEGNLVLEKDEEIPLEISPEEYKKHERQLFAFQDILPIIPGKFKVFFLLKSKTARDFTSFQTEVLVPEERSRSLSNLILYHSKEALGQNQLRKIKAFTFDGFQYVINAQNNFLPQKEMGLYCQAYNLEKKDKMTLLLEIFPMNIETLALSHKMPLSEVATPDGLGIDTGLFPLPELKPGYYRAQASLLDEEGKKIFTEKENFILFSQAYPFIPWAYSKLHNPLPDPEPLYILASQYFMARKYEQAKGFLDRALEKRDEPKTRLLLAKTLYALGQFENSLTIIFPLYQATQDREAAKIIAVDYAGLKDWSAALIYLEKLMEEATEITVLNLAAECYLNNNQPEKALPLIRKSLQLNPNQAAIKELEKQAKKRLENR
jgi:GWxTD domain-containing protein